MSPVPTSVSVVHQYVPRGVGKPTEPAGLVLEAWAEGYMVGSLIILSAITIANMRRGVLLHKLILLELVLGYWQGFFILFNPPVYAWWLSVAAIPLNISWSLHNVISWMKLRPFLSKKMSMLFIGTVILVQPYWVVEIYANFAYFHNVNDIFLKTRPWEALCRDPWWIVAAICLLYNIKSKYDLTALQIAKISPRFAIMLGAMLLSIAFIILDVLSVTDALSSVLPVGINPFWKLSFVFKCLTDAVVLDDFKTALDRLRAFKISRLGSFAIDTHDSRNKDHLEAVENSNDWQEPPTAYDLPKPIANLPPIPESSSITPNGITQVEDRKFAGITRTASRDRDIEENEVKAKGHAIHAELDHERHREASDAHMLGHQENWSQRFGRRSMGSSSDDMDIEYALAVREMTNDAGRPKDIVATK